MQNPIIEKIRKLQALAEGATNEAEAAVAALRVQELLAKHNLELGVAVLSQEPGATQEVGRRWRRMPSHVSTLAWACEGLFDVLHYLRGWRRNGRAIVFIGIKANVEAACITYDYFLASVDALARGAKSQGELLGVDEFLAFRNGAADRIYVLSRELKIRTLEANPGYGELVHIGNAVARQMHDAMNFKGRPLGGRNDFWSRFGAAYRNGFEQGARVDLHGARTNRMLGGGR